MIEKITESLKEKGLNLDFIETYTNIISVIVIFIIAVVVFVAMIRLGINVYSLLVVQALDPLDFSVFQLIFGNILTLFIAMEFMHSIKSELQEKGHVIEVRTILLIAMLALARKFIVMDSQETSPEVMAALAFVFLALGIVYWLLKYHRIADDI
ncbi:MAG: phosphate-starvation-inducible PsiE family protein [Gammaproteobacteria bacterium]|nr:phosphate-starvation-inducible PsiE family protein [Gammaproteobacteria bacterium]